MNYQKEDIIKIFIEDWPGISLAIETISKSKRILEQYYLAAIQGKLEDWRNSAHGKLALILIYDQVPRFIFDDSRAYGTDKIARDLTGEFFKSSEYRILSPLEIMFIFFPYHHSEKMEHQKIANQVFKELYEKDPKTVEWIYQASNDYREIIRRFGRFPHRNKVLGRQSTPEEIKFLERFIDS